LGLSRRPAGNETPFRQSRQQVVVINLKTKKIIGSIEANGVHGIALAGDGGGVSFPLHSTQPSCLPPQIGPNRRQFPVAIGLFFFPEMTRICLICL
jgi:hypothetical protein